MGGNIRKIDMQWVHYGYRLGEVELPHPGRPLSTLPIDDPSQPGVKDNTSITQTGQYDITRRPALGVSIGCHVVGAKDPHACPDHIPTIVAGTAKRAATRTLPRNRQTFRRYTRFVAKEVRKYVPLSADTDVSCRAWLPKTGYTLGRRDELQMTNDEIRDIFDFVHTLVKAFIKAEPYPEYKHSRGIYSTSDAFKTIFGPYIKCIEEVVYCDPEFVKKIPMRDRPKALLNIEQNGATVLETDWTSQESHYDRKFNEAGPFLLYRWMTQNLPSQDVFNWCLEILNSPRNIRFKNLVMIIEAVLCSGEMDTSLRNTITNKFTFKFVLKESGLARSVNELGVRLQFDETHVLMHRPKNTFTFAKPSVDSLGLFEGDDGINSIYGNINMKIYEQLGCRVKLVKHDDICEASFCGMIFDRMDMRNVTDPIETIVNFGWLGRRYVSSTNKRKLEILRCKGLSLHYQYPGNPIISSLSQYAMRVTRNITVRPNKIYMDQWNRDQLNEALDWIDKNGLKPEEIGMRTRMLVERKYGIKLEDQYAIERYLDSKNDLEPIDIPCLQKYLKTHGVHYYENYVRYVDTQSPVRDYPLLYMDNFTIHKADVWCDSEPGTRGYFRVRQPRYH
jgi:hypothetical protein